MSNVYVSRRKKKFISKPNLLDACGERVNTEFSRKDSLLELAKSSPPKLTAKALDLMIKKQSMLTR